MSARGDDVRHELEQERLERVVPRSPGGTDMMPDEPLLDSEHTDDPIVRALLERNRLLREQNNLLGPLHTEVLGLRSELALKPRREEILTRRQITWLLGFGLLLFLLTAYGAIWLHEAYRDRCENVPPTASVPGWCGPLFPGERSTHAD